MISTEKVVHTCDRCRYRARQGNIDLSRRRAASVKDYLVAKYNFDRNRFVAVGNGPDNPVADNNTEEGREKNRRTDFRLIPAEDQ